MRVKCNVCGESYSVPPGAQQHYDQARAIVDALCVAHTSNATRGLVAALLLQRVALSLRLPALLVPGIAQAYSTLAMHFGPKAHPTLRLVN